jgi:hypothetical protein
VTNGQGWKVHLKNQHGIEALTPPAGNHATASSTSIQVQQSITGMQKRLLLMCSTSLRMQLLTSSSAVTFPFVLLVNNASSS